MNLILKKYFNSQRQLHRNKIIPICGLGASVGCERFKRTFNTPRLKSQIGMILFLWSVNFACDKLNFFKKPLAFSKLLC